jgi:hypothetical protein
LSSKISLPVSEKSICYINVAEIGQASIVDFAMFKPNIAAAKPAYGAYGIQMALAQLMIAYFTFRQIFARQNPVLPAEYQLL